MCRHLAPLEKELHRLGIKETYRGQPWSENCREWVYFDCYLDIENLRIRLHIPDFVTHHRNDDQRSGTEEGFYCEKCKDGIMGYNRTFRNNPGITTIS